MVRLEQIAALLEYLENEPDIAHDDCISTCEGRTALFWVKCAKRLNIISPNCPQKSPSEWRKFYNEYKCKVMMKVKLRQREMEVSGGDTNRVTKLTPLQIRLYNLLEWEVLYQWQMSPTTHDRISEIDESEFATIASPCNNVTELTQTESQEQFTELAPQPPDCQPVIEQPANHTLVSPHQSTQKKNKKKSSCQTVEQKSISCKPAAKKSDDYQRASYEPISLAEPINQSDSLKPVILKSVGHEPIILKAVRKPANQLPSHQSTSQQPISPLLPNQPVNHQSDGHQPANQNPASDQPSVPETPADQPQQMSGLQLSNNRSNLRPSKSLRFVITQMSDASMREQVLVKSPKQLPNLDPLNHKASHPPTLQQSISPQLSNHQPSVHSPLHQSLNNQIAIHQSPTHQSFKFQLPHQALSDQTSIHQTAIHQLPTYQSPMHQSSTVQLANPPQPIPQQPPIHQMSGHQPSNHQNAGYTLRSQKRIQPPKINLRSPRKRGRPPKDSDMKVLEEVQGDLERIAKKHRKVEAQLENARATNNLAEAIHKLGASLDIASTRLAGAMEKMADLFEFFSEPEPTPS